ncbi:MAG: UDP-2,4-diacetamido-2,4,6-trideoxy-beta-L-altropyranose hydrolase [Chitinophagales bacterium]
MLNKNRYKNEKNLVIRADASASIGSGHLMRCLALGQAWRDNGGQVVFITSCNSNQKELLLQEKFEVIEVAKPHPDSGDLALTTQVLSSCPGAWLVLDGYNFDPSYQLAIKNTGHRLMITDDMAHLNHYYADVILNQNIYALDLNYPCESKTRLLMGIKYVLLRQQFRRWKDWQREVPDKAAKILVTLGGGDSKNVTESVLKAIKFMELPPVQIKVIIGGNNPHYDDLRMISQEFPVDIVLIRDAQNMPELMAWADLAITAAGSTAWEMAFMGLPSLVIILADNQRWIAEALEKKNVAVNLGHFENLAPDVMVNKLKWLMADVEERQRMSNSARTMIDGKGVYRVLDALIPDQEELS